MVYLSSGGDSGGSKGLPPRAVRKGTVAKMLSGNRLKALRSASAGAPSSPGRRPPVKKKAEVPEGG
jgi:hypothetical protein